MKNQVYMLADSYHIADNQARYDFGWKRYDRSHTYITPHGEIVKVITDCHRLNGISRGTKLYLGHKYWNARGFKEYILERFVT